MEQTDYLVGLTLEQRASMGIADSVVDSRIDSNVPLLPLNGWTRDSSVLPDLEPEAIQPVPEVPNQDCEDGLNGKQMACIRLLVEGETISRAAHRIGVSRRVVFMWQRNPKFLRVLRLYNKEATQASINKMRQASKKITEELIRLATDKFVEPKDRLRAATIVLTTIQEQDAIEEVSDRITELEGHKSRPDTGLYRIILANNEEV